MSCCPECGSEAAWKEANELFLCFMCGLLFSVDAVVECEGGENER